MGWSSSVVCLFESLYGANRRPHEVFLGCTGILAGAKGCCMDRLEVFGDVGFETPMRNAQALNLRP